MCVNCDIGEVSEEQPPPRPNVLLILTDDMGYGDVTSSGNPYLKTPALDQLAKQSIHFRRFYVSPVCAPTRASLLTGRYHQRTGVRSVTNGYETMNEQEITLAEILKQHGYRTGLFGKWHLGEYFPHHPNAQGFDEFIGFRTGHTAVYNDATLEYNARSKKTKGYIADVLTEEALRFMETTPVDQPFFCFLSINTPHTPLIIDSSWVQPYWKMGLDDRTARIYGMIANIDQNISEIEKRLRSAQLLENTIIIFLSDNGPISGWRVPQEKMRYNAKLRDQKFTIYEGGIRTQCYWRWEGHWQPQEITAGLGAHIDIFPTLLNELKIPIPSSLKIDGIDLQPLLSGSSETGPDRIFFQNYSLQTLRKPAPFPGGVAITNDGWKMVNGEELYYLPADSSENFNRAQDRPEYFAELKGAYLEWWESIREDCSAELLPIPIGYAEENPVLIQPHHGKAKGNLEFRGKRGLQGERTGTHPSGVDGDWLGNWKNKGDQISWKIDIVEARRYEVSLLLKGLSALKSANLKMSVGNQEKTRELSLLKESESWAPFLIDTFELQKGVNELRLELMEDMEERRLEVRGVRFQQL